MSKRECSRSKIREILEATLRGHSLTLGSNQPSEKDKIRIANAISLWFLVIRDLSKSYGLERNYSDANLQRSASQLAGRDLYSLTATIDRYLLALRHWSPVMGDQRFCAYKAHVLQPDDDSVLRELIWPFFTLMFRRKSDLLQVCFLFRDINTILQFWKRLTLKDLEDAETKVLESFVEKETEMKTWQYPSEVVEEIRSIVSEWFDGFDIYGYRPHHSNGATSEVRRGKGIEAKFRSCDYGLNHRMLELLTGQEDHPLVTRRDESKWAFPSATFQAVPKGVDKKRGINMEPTSNMFWQHAVADAMDDWFDSHKEINVSLHDQDLSRQMCLEGSRRLCYATIDLSEASDSVTKTLVDLVTKNTMLNCYLMYPRTETCRVGDRVITLEKYAPMGSALCFPVECVIFSAVAKLACMHVGCKCDYRVYGDDIVLPSEAYEECINILTHLHFKVNEEKSFGPYSPFLEACGVEAFFGFDVTPCRLSRWWDYPAYAHCGNAKSPTMLDGSIVFANRLYTYGLFETRREVIADILHYYGAVPFSVDPEKGIYHPNPGNTHLKCVRDSDYQKSVHRVVTCVSSCEKGSDWVRYQALLERYELTERKTLCEADDLLNIKVGPTHVRLKYTWRDLDEVRYTDPSEK